MIARQLMNGERDHLEYRLAELLGIPLLEVRALPEAELVEWGAWFKYRAAMDDLQNKTAASRSQARS